MLSFAWVIFLARALTVELFGRYNLVNSLVTVFSFLPDLGVGLIIIREIAKDKTKAPLLLGNSLVLNGILAMLTFFIILSSTFFFNLQSEVKILIIIASTTLFFSTLRSVGVFYFDGTEKMNYSAMLNSLNTVLLLFLGFIYFWVGKDLKDIFLGMLVGTLISLLVTWIKVTEFIHVKISFNYSTALKLLREGLPLGVVSFSALIYTKIDSILLAYFLGERSVGIYNSATPFIFALIQLLNVPFVVAVYPALSRLSKENVRFKKAVFKSLLLIASWSIPAAILVSFFSNIFLSFLGAKYKEAIPILQLLIFFVPFASLSALLYKVLIVLGKQKFYLFISILGSIINIILNIFLIQKFSIMGAAIASVLTQAVLFSMYGFFVYFFLRK